MAFIGVNTYETATQRASHAVYLVLKQESESFYLRMRFVRFYENISRVQACLKESVRRKRAREQAVFDCFSLYVSQLQEMNTQTLLSLPEAKKSSFGKKKPQTKKPGFIFEAVKQLPADQTMSLVR